jgi:uncharacterized peroxidase-related enzyme
MAYVNEVEETQADARLREIYRGIEQGFGFVPNYFKALGPLPEVIEAQLRLTAAVMEDGALTKIQKEQIGLVVSGITSSSYCIFIHMQLLRRFGVEKSLARKLTTDYENAAADAKLKVLFRFADKLTRKPYDIEGADIEAVRKGGWDDAALRETVLTVAFFNYINRVSLGLGLVNDY